MMTLTLVKITVYTTSATTITRRNGVPETHQEDLYCKDETNPCKCESFKRAFVDKKDRLHWYTEYTCLKNQDTKMLAQLKEAGYNFECAQLRSKKIFNLCLGDEMKNGSSVVYNSACELRFVSDLVSEK